ncbi:MAG: hypothetical protein methR_P1867 [Methyloprofundus sp.]|nr:MAG: hypothetical protein methR_P1867 [Methyloprofundus sp.]
MKKQFAQHTHIYLVFFTSLIIASILAFNIDQRNQIYRDNQYLLAKKSVTGLSSSINLYIKGLRKQVYLLTDQEQTLINYLANNPSDIPAYKQLEDKIALHFPKHFSWTIASGNGQALLESFDYLVGLGCRRDIKKFTSDTNSNQIYVHTSPQQKPYHFDMMVPLGESKLIFFISFNLDDLTQLLKSAEVPGHHLLLMKQEEKNLIEVTAEGAFDSIVQDNNQLLWQAIADKPRIYKKNNLRLSQATLENLEFFMPVPGTKWLLADLPDKSFYNTQEKLHWFETLFIFIILTIISSLIIFFLKKRQDQFLLLSNEQKLKAFINSTPVMMWVSKAPKQSVIHNDAWLKFNKNITIHAEDREPYDSAFKKGLDSHTPFAHEYRQLDKNQQYRWLRETAVPRFNEQHHYQGHTGICIDITEKKLSDEADKILFTVLKYSFESLDEFLDKSLQKIVSIPWLSLSNKAGIFLVDDDAETQRLKLVCSHNLDPKLQVLCAQVDFGHCLCGRAALLKTTQFADCVDERHDTHFPGMQAHGHYNIPLMHGQQLLGVMVLYLEHGHKQQTHEVQFLEHASQILGLGISKHQAELQVRKQAYFDPITNLPNRYLLMDKLQQAYIGAKQEQTKNALILIDLDYFKNINDSLGHMVGDQVLKQVSLRFLSVLRKQDFLARYSGDEFVIILKGLNHNKETTLNTISNTLKKLQDIIAEAFLINGVRIFIKMSMGIALIPDNGNNAHEILSHADAAMYQAKHSGRNTFIFFSEKLQEQANERRQLEEDLRHALELKQLTLFFQPQINELGLITGVEALIRWLHPRHGFVSPVTFIPIAEESGLILEIGRWVLQMACQQFNKFCAADTAGALTHIAVNVSAHQLHHPDFLQHVEQAISQSGLQAQQLTLEVTESMMVADTEDTIEKMHQLKQLGVCFSMDDFGTGYSSLSYLKRLPLAQLKIDKSFVDDIASDASDRVIVKTIISMAQHLNLRVIAEGVENDIQATYLKQAGCSHFQGYLYSKPVDADQLISLLAENKSW